MWFVDNIFFLYKQVRLYERTLSYPNYLENTTVSISDTPLTTQDQPLPLGTECRTLINLQEEITKDFVQSVKCPPGASGRYMQVMKGGEFLVVVEIEVYVSTSGESQRMALILCKFKLITVTKLLSSLCLKVGSVFERQRIFSLQIEDYSS